RLVLSAATRDTTWFWPISMSNLVSAFAPLLERATLVRKPLRILASGRVAVHDPLDSAMPSLSTQLRCAMTILAEVSVMSAPHHQRHLVGGRLFVDTDDTEQLAR